MDFARCSGEGQPRGNQRLERPRDPSKQSTLDGARNLRSVPASGSQSAVLNSTSKNKHFARTSEDCPNTTAALTYVILFPVGK